jgi:uncharacterized membrane protein
MHPGLKGNILEEEISVSLDNRALENILVFSFCFKFFFSRIMWNLTLLLHIIWFNTVSGK